MTSSDFALHFKPVNMLRISAGRTQVQEKKLTEKTTLIVNQDGDVVAMAVSNLYMALTYQVDARRVLFGAYNWLVLEKSRFNFLFYRVYFILESILFWSSWLNIEKKAGN